MSVKVEITLGKEEDEYYSVSEIHWVNSGLTGISTPNTYF